MLRALFIIDVHSSVFEGFVLPKQTEHWTKNSYHKEFLVGFFLNVNISVVNLISFTQKFIAHRCCHSCVLWKTNTTFDHLSASLAICTLQRFLVNWLPPDSVADTSTFQLHLPPANSTPLAFCLAQKIQSDYFLDKPYNLQHKVQFIWQNQINYIIIIEKTLATIIADRLLICENFTWSYYKTINITHDIFS